MDAEFLNQVQLSDRWMISTRTLEKWRSERKGPPFVKVGGAVRYRLVDVIAWERDHTLSPVNE